MRTKLVIAMLLVLATPSIGLGQGPAPARFVWAKPSPPPVQDRSLGPGFLGRGDQDHRYTGFWIGVGLGTAATVFSVAWCSDGDNDCSVSRALVLGPVLTGVLGLSGAVIGGLFPKAGGREESSGSSTLRST